MVTTIQRHLLKDLFLRFPSIATNDLSVRLGCEMRVSLSQRYHDISLSEANVLSGGEQTAYFCWSCWRNDSDHCQDNESEADADGMSMQCQVRSWSRSLSRSRLVLLSVAFFTSFLFSFRSPED